jgi:carboxymethylenebutenolidase
MGEMVTFPSNGATCDGYLALPADGGGAGVVVVQEYWGLVDHIKQVCDRLAGAGYVALAPDLYHGAAAEEPDEAKRLKMGLEMDRAATDIQGAARYLSSRAETTGTGVGAIGFCMGGSLALWSGAMAEEVKVAVGFYPALPWEEMSPTWGNYNGKSAMIHCSEADGTSRAPGIHTAVMGIQEAGGDVEVYDYPGSQHAFFNDERPESYAPDHAAKAWRRTLALFSSRL